MRNWLKDDVLRRVARNTGLLGAGKVAGGVLHLVSLALTARLLDPAAFGLLMLARSYAQAAAALAKFQSWQAVVTFGAAAQTERRPGGLRGLCTFTVLLDAATGLAALALAMTAAPRLGPWIGIPPTETALAVAYCLAVPILVAGTPLGLLRLYDRFDLMAWQALVTPTVRMAAVLLAWAAGAPLWALVAAWLISDIAGELFLWVAAVRVGRARGLFADPAAPLRSVPRQHRGLWRYLFATNLNASLQQGAAPFYTILVGGLLGASAAGAYRLAQTILEAVAVPAELAMRSLFPEVARLNAQGAARARQVVARFAVLSAGAGLILAALLALAAPWAVPAALGADYAVAGDLLRILSAVVVALFMGSILETALLAGGRAGRALAARAAATLASVALAIPLAPVLGLTGIGAALVIGAAIGTGFLYWSVLAARAP
ncbi:MAG: lipopolysaccharide biosynthesis protein [Pseudomonadota bacterium]